MSNFTLASEYDCETSQLGFLGYSTALKKNKEQAHTKTGVCKNKTFWSDGKGHDFHKLSPPPGSFGLYIAKFCFKEKWSIRCLKRKSIKNITWFCIARIRNKRLKKGLVSGVYVNVIIESIEKKITSLTNIFCDFSNYFEAKKKKVVHFF